MRRLGGIAGRVIGSLALALLLLGLPILVLQAPIVTRALVIRYYDASAGMSLPASLSTSEKVRAYTTEPGASPLSVTVDGQPGFDAAAACHVRVVLGLLIAEPCAVLAC